MDSSKAILSRLLETNTKLDYMKATDEELVDLVQKKKDKKAEETLIKRYDGLVAHVGKNYFLKDGDSDDIKQEGLIGLVGAMRDFVPGKNKNFKQFAMLAVKRNMTDAVRKSTSKKSSVLSNAEDYSTLERPTKDGDPEKALMNKESHKRIQDYMKKNLTDHENKVLAQYLKGLTYQQIADKLGINRKSVDNAINSVRSKMRTYKSSIKDSKIIRIIESILNETASYSRLREAYAYIYEEEENDTPTAKYKKYLKDHRAGVREAYETILKPALLSEGLLDEILLRKIQALIDTHDASKNSAAEFSAYRNYFYDKEKYPRSSDEFNLAWNHHQCSNPHHWQYWVLINDVDEPQLQPLEMPIEYVVELLCDWQSAGKHYGNSAYEWYNKQKDKMILHDNTRKLIEKYIELLK